MIMLIMILIMIKVTRTCKRASWIDEESQWYRAEIKRLEVRIMELEAEAKPTANNRRKEYLQK